MQTFRAEMRAWVGRLCFVLTAFLAAPTFAQENDAGADVPPKVGEQAEEPQAPASDPAVPAPQTQPPDYGFGENQLNERYYFPDASRYSPRVDRRLELDAAPQRTILLPTAYTPEQFTVQFSTFMLVLYQATFAITDSAQVGATVKLPGAFAPLQAGLSAKFNLFESPDTAFSIQPFGMYRDGTLDEEVLGTSDLGFGIAALFDFAVSNNFVMTLGATAYGTMLYRYGVFTYDACESRSDYLEGSCRETATESISLPPGGHFVALHVAATYYILDQWSLKGELMSGVGFGTVLGTDFVADVPDADEDRARFEVGEAALGVPYDSPVSAGLGFQWSNGLLAVQASGYAHFGVGPPGFTGLEPPRTILFTPMLNASVAF